MLVADFHDLDQLRCIKLPIGRVIIFVRTAVLGELFLWIIAQASFDSLLESLHAANTCNAADEQQGGNSK